MKLYRIEVFADARPIHLPNDQLKATNHGVAARRGYILAKQLIRRGTKTVTIRATVLGGVDQTV